MHFLPRLVLLSAETHASSAAIGAAAIPAPVGGRCARRAMRLVRTGGCIPAGRAERAVATPRSRRRSNRLTLARRGVRAGATAMAAWHGACSGRPAKPEGELPCAWQTGTSMQGDRGQASSRPTRKMNRSNRSSNHTLHRRPSRIPTRILPSTRPSTSRNILVRRPVLRGASRDRPSADAEGLA